MKKKKNFVLQGWYSVLQYTEEDWKIVLQYTIFVLQRKRLNCMKLYCNTMSCIVAGRGCRRQELYHNTLHCIVAETLAVGRIVSQYSSLYCDRGKAWTVLQYSHCAHDIAKLGAGQGAGGAAGRAGRAGKRWGDKRAGASGRAGMSGRAVADGRAGGRRAGARGAQAGRRQRARQAQTGRRRGRAGRAAWACLCAQAGRAGWSAGPSWCTVHLAQF